MLAKQAAQRIRRVGQLGLFLAAAALAQKAQATDQGPVIYKLTERSTYQTGCFPPCECSLTEKVPVHGMFLLSPAGFDGLFHNYEVTQVEWTVWLGYEELRITGSGTYRVGGEFASMHELELDLAVGDDPPQHFHSGLIVGGAEFPRIDIVISINDMYCLDTVIHVDAVPVGPPPRLPRHAHFVLHPKESTVEFSLFVGGTRSPLIGSIRLFLGDPGVPVIAIPGMVGLSVDGADLIAPDFEPDLPGLPEPLHMIQDPDVRSIGAWNTHTGEIGFELHLTTADGIGLAVPQPVQLTGTLTNAGLKVAGDNGNVADGYMALEIKAFEVPLPPPPIDIWFSTENGFGAGHVSPSADGITPISDGDLLSRRGHIVRTNHELTARLGIMPVVPDLGLDAVVLGPGHQIWFSFEEEIGQIWSETLGVWLKQGDLLSDAGYVVQTNEQLLERFGRMPMCSDAGLDAVARAPNRAILFSTEESFFSETLGVTVGHGDLLCNRGRIVRTNRQLLERFDIIDLTMSPIPPDYGLDAIVLRPNKEIWFSTEMGFYVQDLDDATAFRWISDGALLSTRGYVVAGNLELVAPFEPVEDVDNFGLDAVNVVVPVRTADFDHDGDVDQVDFGLFQASISGVDVPTAADATAAGDVDGDGDVDQDDFGLFQECISGPNVPADAM